jgi:hypothetical protein
MGNSIYVSLHRYDEFDLGDGKRISYHAKLERLQQDLVDAFPHEKVPLL